MIGLISDTHGLLRPEALDALRGAELIVHAGDVGKLEILDELGKLAPVIAIRGNVDTIDLPSTARMEHLGVTLFVIHDVHDLDFDPGSCGVQIVISGHSHKPSRQERNGVLYLNPGSAGPRRFKLPITIARLHLGTQPWGVEFVTLG